MGLAFGAYGEASKSVHTLVKKMAAIGALAWKRKLPTASLAGAQGRLAWMIRRRIGMASFRAQAQLLLDRVEFVGSGAPARMERRRKTSQQHRWRFHEDARHEHDRARQSDHTAEGARCWHDYDGFE